MNSMTSRPSPASAPAIGRLDAAIAAIQQVLANLREVGAVFLYGSRAPGPPCHASDIDLTMIGPGPAISARRLARIETISMACCCPW
jgi:hypothetical protein